MCCAMQCAGTRGPEAGKVYRRVLYAAGYLSCSENRSAKMSSQQLPKLSELSAQSVSKAEQGLGWADLAAWWPEIPV